MDRPLKILMLVKKFAKIMPKHQHKYDMLTAIEHVAEVTYWDKDGDIREILQSMEFTPDFIFHYDIEWSHAFSPVITHLDKVNILKGCYVLDLHFSPRLRRDYFHKSAKPDMIFSATKSAFLNAYPECASRFTWMPFAINPEVIKDYKLEKDITYSLMGLINQKYPFRQAVFEKMKPIDGFVCYEHPGHRTSYRPGLFINELYAMAFNRSLLSFTCGSALNIPVAKFFEIPGCHTLMLAEPNLDMEELGFREDNHYVACNKANFYHKAMYYAHEAHERAHMTANGHSFIHGNHTTPIRARQFVEAVKAMLAARGSQEA